MILSIFRHANYPINIVKGRLVSCITIYREPANLGADLNLLELHDGRIDIVLLEQSLIHSFHHPVCRLLFVLTHIYLFLDYPRLDRGRG